MIIRDLIINEAVLMEDPIYRQFKSVGQYIIERRMSEKEILQVFADAEAGMTDKATGANRTWMGGAKDTTMDFAGGVKDAVNSVLNSIQNSAPVAAVDVAYDQATDALAGLTGGQKGKVMQAIKTYRNLVKQYPKTAGFAKAALVAIAGLATGGAGLPAIAGLTYALDSAIKGDKLSSVIGKGGGAAALAAAGQAVSGAMNPGRADIGNVSGGQDIGGYNPDNVPGDLMTTPEPGWQSNADVSGMYAQEPGWPGSGAEGGTTDYTAVKGDTLSNIAEKNGVSVKELADANGIDYKDVHNIKAGQTLKIPSETGSAVYDQGVGAGGPGSGMSQADMDNFRADNMNRMADQADAEYYRDKPDDFGINQRSTDAVGTGMPGSAAGSTERYIPQKDGSWLDASTGKIADPAKLQASQAALRNALGVKESVWSKVAESVKFKTLPVDRLIDDKATILSWALNESIGRKSKSINLTAIGAYTIFENIDRYRKGIIKERASVPKTPGRSRPAYYRPDMPGGPGKAAKPGIIGKGLNWLDKTAGKVGGALSNFGHQFTTNVTKEKLKMNWHQDGKPSDSDQLAAWLVKQGVPQQVITSVYNKMGIPHTAPAAAAPAPGAVIKGPAATTTTATAPTATTTVPNFGRQNTGYASINQSTTAASSAPAAPAANPFGQMANTLGTYAPPTTTSTGGTLTQTPTGQVHQAKTNNPNAVVANPATAPTTPVKQRTGGRVKGQPPSETPNAIRKRKARMSKNASADNVKIGKTAPVPKQKWTGPRPTGAQAAEYQQGIHSVPESLSWSRNFNPGMTLFRQMKREQS